MREVGPDPRDFASCVFTLWAGPGLTAATDGQLTATAGNWGSGRRAFSRATDLLSCVRGVAGARCRRAGREGRGSRSACKRASSCSNGGEPREGSLAGAALPAGPTPRREEGRPQRGKRGGESAAACRGGAAAVARAVGPAPLSVGAQKGSTGPRPASTEAVTNTRRAVTPLGAATIAQTALGSNSPLRT